MADAPTLARTEERLGKRRVGKSGGHDSNLNQATQH
jgi:hypothetical protein